jgi:hypothetical protein
MTRSSSGMMTVVRDSANPDSRRFSSQRGRADLPSLRLIQQVSELALGEFPRVSCCGQYRGLLPTFSKACASYLSHSSDTRTACVLNRWHAYPRTDGKREEIDHLTGSRPSMWAPRMRAVPSSTSNLYPEYVSATRRHEYQVGVISFLTLNLRFCSRALAFTETDSSQWGDRKDDRRNTDVIWSLMVSLQEVCGHDQPFIAGHRSQR